VCACMCVCVCVCVCVCWGVVERFGLSLFLADRTPFSSSSSSSFSSCSYKLLRR
jgi:hypothetical protein